MSTEPKIPAPPTAEVKPPPKTPTSKLVEWMKAIVWTVVAWVLLTTFVVQAYRIPSPSMERTLMVG
jgi:signal peptidase I